MMLHLGIAYPDSGVLTGNLGCKDERGEERYRERILSHISYQSVSLFT
jgi:hypothetical protein